MRCLSCTIQNRVDESSGKIDLLPKVYKVRDLRSVGVVGERLPLSGGHDSDVYEEEFRQRARPSSGRF